MPKDNEVSNLDNAITKARSEVDFALCRGPRAMEAREKRLAQIVCLLELAKHDHAATVAELRARADDAERRVVELEDLAGAFLEAADARDNEETSTQYPEHERRPREYKAAREDLSKSLTGADPT